MRVVGAALLAVTISLPAAAGPQTEIDRTLQVVNGQAITTSDVRRAKLLKLIALDADADVQVALENRLLMLMDIGSRQPAPSDEERSARRREWEAALTPDPPLAALLARTGTTEAGLDAWFADDVRIRKYQTQRFGGAPDMAAAIDTWVQSLRRRAGLRIRIDQK